MNTRQVIDNSSSPVSLSASFNEDSSHFAVGLNSGFCIFNSDPCELKASRDFNAGIGAAEMMGRMNYLALVGGGKVPKFPQNKVIIWDDSKQKQVFSIEFRTPVHRVQLSRTRIVVALQNSIHIYKFSSPPEKLSVFETSDNPFGLCCLGSKVIIFPGRTAGQVQIVEIERGNVSIIPAHGSSLRALDLNPDGEIIATASDKGTLIRLFSTRNCAKIAEFRRGVDPATIFSLKISPSNTFLAVTSDKSTLHIFDVLNTLQASAQSGNENEESNPSQKWGVLSKIPLLPRVFSDIYSVATCPFNMGDEPQPSPGSTAASAIVAGVPGGRYSKGIIGWKDDRNLFVVGAGQDGRWERFVINESDDGKRFCVRDGWRKYLGAS